MIRFILFFYCAIFLFIFTSKANKTYQLEKNKYDAIIVLTGYKGRIKKGLDLYKNGISERLFISGVDSDVKAIESNQGIVRPDNNVIFGYKAANTYGNISEIRNWIKVYNLKEILIVSHNYHIPRVKLLMPRNEGCIIEYYGVKEHANILHYAREFLKFFFSCHVVFVTRLFKCSKILHCS